MKSVVLEKVTDLSGEAHLGAIYTYTYKSIPESNVLMRAREALKRDLKDENPLAWKRVT